MIKLPELPELTFEEREHVYKLRGIEIPSVTTLMKPLSENVYQGIHQNVMANAASRGTAIHQAAENYLLFGIEDITTEYAPYFDAFKRWCDDYQPEVIATENRVYHKSMLFAGTSDLICKTRSGITLVDYKSTSSVNSMLCMVQLESYSRAWGTHGFEIDAQNILHLKKTGKYMVHNYPKNPEAWAVMQSLITVRNYMNKF